MMEFKKIIKNRENYNVSIFNTIFKNYVFRDIYFQKCILRDIDGSQLWDRCDNLKEEKTYIILSEKDFLVPVNNVKLYFEKYYPNVNLIYLDNYRHGDLFFRNTECKKKQKEIFRFFNTFVDDPF